MLSLASTQIDTRTALLLAEQRDHRAYRSDVRRRHIQTDESESPFKQTAIHQKLVWNSEQNRFGPPIEMLSMRHIQIDQQHVARVHVMHFAVRFYGDVTRHENRKI